MLKGCKYYDEMYVTQYNSGTCLIVNYRLVFSLSVVNPRASTEGSAWRKWSEKDRL